MVSVVWVSHALLGYIFIKYCTSHHICLHWLTWYYWIIAFFSILKMVKSLKASPKCYCWHSGLQCSVHNKMQKFRESWGNYIVVFVFLFLFFKWNKVYRATAAGSPAFFKRNFKRNCPIVKNLAFWKTLNWSKQITEALKQEWAVDFPKGHMGNWRCCGGIHGKAYKELKFIFSRIEFSSLVRPPTTISCGPLRKQIAICWYKISLRASFSILDTFLKLDHILHLPHHMYGQCYTN